MRPKKKRVQGGPYRKKIITEDLGFLWFFMENVIQLESQLPAHYSEECLHPPVISLLDSGAERHSRDGNLPPAMVMWKRLSHSYTSPCWK